MRLEKGMDHPDLHALIHRDEKMTLWRSIKEVLEKNHMMPPQARQTHVLVVAPGTSFYCRPSRPLQSAKGSRWDFQNPLDNEDVAKAIQTHYKAWKSRDNDNKLHPLFGCISGPGAGRSRMLDEFPTLVKEQLFAEKEVDSEMTMLLENYFTCKV
ncbi:hypothetical protein V7S43_015784 [Phytophthora oleae]|uniref:Uncharacterized protein n=1 Tax=Phytophthora oleae TaxID=2107226 RepID=A0ABD3EYC1_9STRA